MKKIMKFFLNYILISTIVVNVSGCKWGCTNNDYDLSDENEQDISCNYVIPDINKRTKKIISDRLNYIGEDVTNIKNWYLRSSEKWFNKTSKKLKFVANLEEKIQYQASNEANNAFDLLASNRYNFSNFADLQYEFNNTNLGKVNANVNWRSLINSLAITNNEKDEIRNKLVRFYNIFAQIYGKKNVLKLLYRVARTYIKFFGFVIIRNVYDLKFKKFSWVQVMAINSISLNKTTQYWQYRSGYKASKSIIRTIVHEYGHALGNFICLNLQERQDINSLADDNPNAWWNNFFNSSYLLENNFKKTTVSDETNYMISSLANGTKINDPIYQKLLAYGIVRSGYGRESHSDLFAEAFDQWIDTEKEQRNIAWEKLDKFFRIDLPKLL